MLVVFLSAFTLLSCAIIIFRQFSDYYYTFVSWIFNTKCEWVSQFSLEFCIWSTNCQAFVKVQRCASKLQRTNSAFIRNLRCHYYVVVLKYWGWSIGQRHLASTNHTKWVVLFRPRLALWKVLQNNRKNSEYCCRKHSD